MPRSNAPDQWLLRAGVGFDFFAYALFTLAVPLMGVALGASAELIGGVVSLGFLAEVLVAIPLGVLVDRRGVRVPIIGGPLLLAVALGIAIVSRDMWGIAISELLVGAGQVSLVLSGQSETASLAGRSRRTAGFGAFAAAASAGQTIGPLAGGLLMDSAGAHAALALGMSGAVLASLLMVLEQSRQGRPKRQRASSIPRARRRVAYTSPVWYAFIVSAAVVLGRVVFMTFLPLYMHANGFAAGSIGLAIGLLGLVTFSVRPILAWITERIGGMVQAMVTCTVASGAGLLFVSLPPSWIVILGAAVLVGFGGGLGQPLGATMVVDAVAENGRGVVLASRLVASRVAQASGPVALGLVAGFAGLRVTFVAGGGAILSAAAVLLVLARRVVRQLERHDENASLHGSRRPLGADDVSD